MKINNVSVIVLLFLFLSSCKTGKVNKEITRFYGKVKIKDSPLYLDSGLLTVLKEKEILFNINIDSLGRFDKVFLFDDSLNPVKLVISDLKNYSYVNKNDINNQINTTYYCSGDNLKLSNDKISFKKNMNELILEVECVILEDSTESEDDDQ